MAAANKQPMSSPRPRLHFHKHQAQLASMPVKALLQPLHELPLPFLVLQLLERMPALNESEYYRNLGVEMKPIGGSANARPAVSTQIANDLLGDLGECANGLLGNLGYASVRASKEEGFCSCVNLCQPVEVLVLLLVGGGGGGTCARAQRPGTGVHGLTRL